ncbi:MAG: response regulator [Thermomicrobiales bacterium]
MTVRASRRPVDTGTAHASTLQSLSGQPVSASAPLPRATILIVDDEPNIVDLLCVLLEDEGYRVYRAANGLQAIDEIRRIEPALVISDVKMPGLSGEDLARRVVIGMFRTSPRIILMSAMDRPQDSCDVPFIGKPFDIDDFLGLVEEQMQQLSH